MVSPGVGRQVSAVGKLQPQGTWIDTTLQNALWRPDNLPPSRLLNEGSFSRADLLVPGHRPVIWNLFGGQDVRRLTSLVELITMASRNRLKSIEFVHKMPRARSGSKNRAYSYIDVGNPSEP